MNEQEKSAAIQTLFKRTYGNPSGPEKMETPGPDTRKMSTRRRKRERSTAKAADALAVECRQKYRDWVQNSGECLIPGSIMLMDQKVWAAMVKKRMKKQQRKLARTPRRLRYQPVILSLEA